jgi:hypothetical protein
MKWTIFCGGQQKQQIHSPLKLLYSPENYSILPDNYNIASLRIPQINLA